MGMFALRREDFCRDCEEKLRDTIFGKDNAGDYQGARRQKKATRVLVLGGVKKSADFLFQVQAFFCSPGSCGERGGWAVPVAGGRGEGRSIGG